VMIDFRVKRGGDGHNTKASKKGSKKSEDAPC
jgi:hypothetical protein